MEPIPDRIVLHYFALRGRGEVARLMLEDQAVAYEQKLVGGGRLMNPGAISIHDYDALKADASFAGPLGYLPVLRWGELEEINEAMAINQFLGKKLGLWPRAGGDEDRAHVEARAAALAMGAYSMISEKIYADIFNPPLFPKLSPSMRTTAAFVLDRLEAALGEKRWFVGDAVATRTSSSSTPWTSTPRSTARAPRFAAGPASRASGTPSPRGRTSRRTCAPTGATDTSRSSSPTSSSATSPPVASPSLRRWSRRCIDGVFCKLCRSATPGRGRAAATGS